MTTPDIRVGDLIRATSKEYPELFLQGRVTVVGDGYHSVSGRSVWDIRYTYEVLDRPVPKVEDDLMEKVIAAYREIHGYKEPMEDRLRPIYTERLTPVINAVREYDKKAGNK